MYVYDKKVTGVHTRLTENVHGKQQTKRKHLKEGHEKPTKAIERSSITPGSHQSWGGERGEPRVENGFRDLGERQHTAVSRLHYKSFIKHQTEYNNTHVAEGDELFSVVAQHRVRGLGLELEQPALDLNHATQEKSELVEGCAEVGRCRVGQSSNTFIVARGNESIPCVYCATHWWKRNETITLLPRQQTNERRPRQAPHATCGGCVGGDSNKKGEGTSLMKRPGHLGCAAFPRDLADFSQSSE